MATYTHLIYRTMVATLTGRYPMAIDATTAAVRAYKNKETLTLTMEDGTVWLIPYHAVAAIGWVATTEESTKADPYGCEANGGGSNAEIRN